MLELLMFLMPNIVMLELFMIDMEYGHAGVAHD